MNIGIVGFGKMGRQILSCCQSRGFSVGMICDPVCIDPLVSAKKLEKSAVSGCDAVIDFSSPAGIIDNMKFYFENGIPAVIGTTGWYDKLDEVKSMMSPESKIIYSGNFSVGVAVFLRIVKRASEIIDKIPSYDISVREVHHAAKVDSPSGTACMIGDVLLSGISRKDNIVIGNSDGKISEKSIQIVSQRVGKEPGLHDVVFDSEADTITLSHHARSRIGFALGALDAADWLVRQKPGLYSIDDFIDELTGERK